MTSRFPEPARRALRAWYRTRGRHGLPWRQTRDAYAVLVSEVMLQQTQVERVIPYWEGWMERWPDVASLAQASPAEVIQAWAGLGYNRRALNLHRAAVVIVEQHNGRVPADTATLGTLPGVGGYTASAVACFAGERRVAVVDTNIARVIARVALGVDKAAATQGDVRLMASETLPARAARDWNLALMDLGATVCTARTPGCAACPVRRWCAWHADGQPVAAARTGAGAPRFEETARYARGRIIATLRHGPLEVDGLSGVAGEAHRQDMPKYLEALRRDGMVEAADGGWRLPGDTRPAQGRMSMASPKL